MGEGEGVMGKQNWTARRRRACYHDDDDDDDSGAGGGAMPVDCTASL